MVGHILSKRQQKLKNKGKLRKKRTSLKLRKLKAPDELRVKRGKSKTFDEVLSTGRRTGRANSFLKSSGGGSGRSRAAGGGAPAAPADPTLKRDGWRPANPALTAEFPRPMPLSTLPEVVIRRNRANAITAQNVRY